MKVQHKYFIIITAIVLIISLPPIICYKFLVNPPGDQTSDTKTSGNSEDVTENDPPDENRADVSKDQGNLIRDMAGSTLAR